MTSPLNRRREADAAALAITIDRRSHEPLLVQLVRTLRELILTGRMAPGARLPSSRTLAVDLDVSRATVVATFEQLMSEGYVEGRRGAGVFVSSSLPEQSLQIAVAGRLGSTARRSPPRHEPMTAVPFRPFQIGATDASLFPHADWARLLYRTWRQPSRALVGSQHPFGWRPLRQAIAEHLALWRGVVTAPEAIVITCGTADAIDVIAATAFDRGDRIYVEEPGYPALRRALGALGLQSVPVPVDTDGFELARALSAGPARGVVVTPSRQFPLGATLPLSRRLALLDWAEKRSGYIIEDDFDSEYRYEGTPLPALTSLDRHGRTIYLGSFSKVLSSALRLGFVVLPPALLDAAERHLRLRGVLASLIAQPVLADFMSSGAYARHIRRTRRIYARRMAAMLSEGRALEGLLTIEPGTAGMHVVAGLGDQLSDGLTDAAVAEIAARAGVFVTPLSYHYAAKPGRQALLLGFAGFEEHAIAKAVRRLATALEPAARKPARPSQSPRRPPPMARAKQKV